MTRKLLIDCYLPNPPMIRIIFGKIIVFGKIYKLYLLSMIQFIELFKTSKQFTVIIYNSESSIRQLNPRISWRIRQMAIDQQFS